MINLDAAVILFLTAVVLITIPTVIYHEVTHILPKETVDDE